MRGKKGCGNQGGSLLSFIGLPSIRVADIRSTGVAASTKQRGGVCLALTGEARFARQTPGATRESNRVGCLQTKGVSCWGSGMQNNLPAQTPEGGRAAES